uniref:DUF559 domain-containing protein n=1 Tax=viral metagenome TaxID=1070528 RepID=A0A6C0I6B4_9ZZZZ
MKQKTTEQFILEARKIHGDRYDYSKVEYTGKDNKIIIRCKEHGDFEQRPNSHLRGMKCRKCSGIDSSMKQRGNLDNFINKAIQLHGDKYDYSKVEYVNAKCKVIIICKVPDHGEFVQVADTHLTGSGCKKCGHILRGESKKFTKKEFIEKITEIHGNTYDYSKVEYTGCHDKIIIGCREHGDFKQQANSHLRGRKCKKCSDKRNGEKKTYTNEEFIEKITEIHGDTYDYSKVQYTGNKNKIIIICKVPGHGEFEQIAAGHIGGCGCNLCGNERISQSLRHTQTDFIRRAFEKHGETYDYSKSVYNGIDNLITIICNKTGHGEFEQTPYLHIKGCGCPTCAIENLGQNRISNKEEFIEKAIKIHEDTYDYSDVEYIKSNIKIRIRCKTHGIFEQTPNGHLCGSGCPYCVNKTEGKLYNKMQSVYPSLIAQFKQEWCRKQKHLPFDFCIQDHKIIIELDGLQHFKQVSNWCSPDEQFENDKFKEECANNNGYSVIRLLQHDVFYDTYDWVKELCDSIEELKNGDEIANIYLCKNNEYANY